jgi:hypothetical protein
MLAAKTEEHWWQPSFINMHGYNGALGEVDVQTCGIGEVIQECFETLNISKVHSEHNEYVVSILEHKAGFIGAERVVSSRVRLDEAL